jgi:serine/threonine-protein kinase
MLSLLVANLDHTPIAGAPRTGDTIDGKYVVERVPPNAAMGGVFFARNRQQGGAVAIKLVLDTGEMSEEGRRRFKEESRLASDVDSPYVARAIDSGFWNGRPYLVMAAMEGEDLETRLAKRAKLAVAEAIDIATEIAHALAQAHLQGIIHRDVKPSNIFIAKQAGGGEIAKLLDCGIAKARYTPGARRSPVYMSPEQVKGTAMLDVTSDIWSLACVLYQMLAGRAPFAEPTPDRIVSGINTKKHAPVRTLRPECPEPIDAALTAALVKELYDRTQHIEELASAVAPWGSARAGAVLDSLRGSAAPNSDRTMAASAPSEQEESSEIATLSVGASGQVKRDSEPPTRIPQEEEEEDSQQDVLTEHGEMPTFVAAPAPAVAAPPSSARALAAPMTGSPSAPTRKAFMPTPATTPMGFAPMSVSQAASPASAARQSNAQPVHTPLMSAPAMAAAAPVVHRAATASRPEFTPSGQREVSRPPDAIGSSPNAMGSSPNALGSNPNVLGSSPNIPVPQAAAAQNWPALPTVPGESPVSDTGPAKAPKKSIALPLTIAVVAGAVFVGEMIAFAIVMMR